MEDWLSVAQQAFLLTIIHFGFTSCQIPEEELKINVNDNFSLKACTWSGDCCRGIRLGRQWNQIKQGSSLYQTPAVATSGLCAPSPSTQRVGSLHSNVPYFPVMFLKLKSSRQSLSPHLFAASKLQRVGLAPLGTALAQKGEKLFPSLHLWKSLFFLAAAPPSSSSPLPTCLVSSPSAVAKTGSSPKQPPLTLSFPAPPASGYVLFLV